MNHPIIQPQKIELKESFLNTWIDSISNHVGANSVALGFFTRMILFFIVASLIVEIFWDKYPWLAGGIIALVLLADIGFTLSALMAAKFYKSKVMLYARIFFGISVFGLLFICWKLYDFTDLIYPLLAESEYATKSEYKEVLYLRYSLNAIFFTTAILAFLFTEGGAYMIFTLTSKEEPKAETSETEIAKNKPKQGENNDFAILEKEIQAKVEKLTLPDSIEKIGTDSYCIDYGKAKTYETIAGNMRANRSKYKGFLKEKDVDKAANTKSLENYYQEILDIIESENSKTDSNWEFFPNGTLKKEKVRPINGHKKEPDFFEKETI